ncbi:MAG TPA: hypothetical protein VGB92_18155 [Longimicrobium sp.]|jgi:hypothetical protein
MLDATQLARHVQQALEDITQFVVSPPFERVLAEFAAVPREQRSLFIRSVLINPEELERRGVQIPEGLTVQRSAFEDDRPTLFCVTKYLPDMGTAKKKVTVTFDDGWERALDLHGAHSEPLLGETYSYEPIVATGTA